MTGKHLGLENGINMVRYSIVPMKEDRVKFKKEYIQFKEKNAIHRETPV